MRDIDAFQPVIVEQIGNLGSQWGDMSDARFWNEDDARAYLLWLLCKASGLVVDVELADGQWRVPCGILLPLMSTEDWRPRNPDLYQHLRTLANDALVAFISRASADASTSELRERMLANDDGGTATGTDPQWQWLLMTNAEHMKESPRFKKCVELLLDDESAVEHAPSSERQPGHFGELFLVPFLTRFVAEAESRRLNPPAFDILYQDAEEALYSSTRVFRASSFLRRFSAPVDELPLTDHIRIRKLSEPEKHEKITDAWRSRVSHVGTDVLMASFVIEVDQEIPASDRLRYVPVDEFEGVVSALRLFKAGAVRLGRIEQRAVRWYADPNTAGTLSAPEEPGPGFGSPYVLEDEETDRFAEFYRWMSSVDTSRELAVQLAMRRFNSAYTRHHDADRLIDLMISFEALLLGERDELSFRLALRTANLLRDRRKRQETFDIMRKAYELRSNVAHGKHVEPQALSGIIVPVEELLRQSLCLFLEAIEREEKLSTVVERLDGAMFTD